MNYLELATRIACADLNKVKDFRKNYTFGAVCIRHDGSITTATNILTQFPNPNAHTEKRVLAKAGFGATLYLVRITRDKRWADSRPCPACEALIKNMHVKKVVYSVGPDNYQVWKV